MGYRYVQLGWITWIHGGVLQWTLLLLGGRTSGKVPSTNASTARERAKTLSRHSLQYRSDVKYFMECDLLATRNAPDQLTSISIEIVRSHLMEVVAFALLKSCKHFLRIGIGWCKFVGEGVDEGLGFLYFGGAFFACSFMFLLYFCVLVLWLFLLFDEAVFYTLLTLPTIYSV